jgi:hypothetical protein
LHFTYISLISDPALDKHEEDTGFKHMGSTCYVKESDIIRECIYMLSGHDSHIFSFNEVNSNFIVLYLKINEQYKSKISLLHLSDDTLKNAMNNFASMGSCVKNLELFCERCVQVHKIKTIQAFCASISSIVTKFRREISKLEMEISCQIPGFLRLIVGELQSASLIEFKEWVRLHSVQIMHIANFLMDLKLIDGLTGFNLVLTPADSEFKSNDLSIYILDNLYFQICTCQQEDEIKSATFLTLFIKASQPLFLMIDELLLKGYLEDPFEEFFVAR